MKNAIKIAGALVIVVMSFFNVSFFSKTIDNKDSVVLIEVKTASAQQGEWADNDCSYFTGNNFQGYTDIMGDLCSDPEGNVCGIEANCTPWTNDTCADIICTTWI